jgi:hypothetical protein
MRRLKNQLILAGLALFLILGVFISRSRWSLPAKPEDSTSQVDDRSLANKKETDSARAREAHGIPSGLDGAGHNEGGIFGVTFGELVAKHRKERKRAKDSDDHLLGFGWSRRFGYVQARLMALCNTAEVEALASNLVSDSTSTQEDLILAAKVFGVLTRECGSKAAENLLVRLVQGKDPEVVAVALDELFSNDKDGVHRALYWTKCSEGMLLAFWQGPYWPDGQTRQSLQSFFEMKSTPQTKDFASGEAIERMGILESPDRPQKLDQLLSSDPIPGDATGKKFRWQHWVLNVVRRNPTENTVEILRKRLENGEVNAARVLISEERFPPIEPTHPGYSSATGDVFYDEALLTYQILGGKLNQFQEKRLRYYGYLGDPAERLAALIQEDAKNSR